MNIMCPVTLFSPELAFYITFISLSLKNTDHMLRN